METELLFTRGETPLIKILSSGDGKFTLNRPNASRPAFASITLALEPLPENEFSCVLSWRISEQKIPLKYFHAVIEGVKGALLKEEIPGKRLVGTAVIIIDGEYSESNSSAWAFYMAAAHAFKIALENSNYEVLT
jgi:elongation factor G